MTRSNEELTRAFEAGELDLETLSIEERDALIDGADEIVQDVESNPNLEQPVGDNDNVEQVVEEEGGVNDSSPKPEAEEEPTLKRKLYEKSNELNTLDQKYQNLLKKSEEAPKPKPVIDRENMWNDDVVAKKWERLEEMYSTFQLREKREQEFEAKKSQDSMFSEVSDFQKTTPALSTKRDCKEIDALYVQSYSANNVEPSMEEMKSLGVSEQDFKNYKHLSEMIAYKKDNNLRTLKAAYHDSDKASEFDFTDPTENAKRQATQKSYERAEERPKVLGNGSGGEQGGWSDESMNNWLTTHPDPSKYNAEDRETAKAIYSKLDL